MHKRIARSKSNNSRNRNGKNNCNRKGSPRLAIVHVVMKSSSTAPPAAAHAEYIARDGKYQQRGGLDLVESGNMPRFAEENPQAFWQAADDFERKNGRAYTELQIALPRELAPDQRNELARDTARELMGERFAYTLAVHTPLAKDNIEQPHMHLMFSERAIDERTRELSEEQFFKRNGAKKDPEWNAREKPMEVREKWVEMMNAAMERHGHVQRLDHRSWADQGRHDLAELVEPKLLAGSEAEARALHAHVDGLREQRAELPGAHLSADKVIDRWEQQAEQQIAQVREREEKELSRLDKLIAAARELAHEVKDRTVAFAKDVKERAGSLFGRESKEEQARAAAQEKAPEEARPPTPELQARLDDLVAGFQQRMEAQLSVQQRAAEFGNRMDAKLQAQELARQQAEAQKAQEQAKTKEPEVEAKQEHSQGRGFGISR